MGANGIYLNPWYLSFDPKNKVPTTISIYISLISHTNLYWKK